MISLPAIAPRSRPGGFVVSGLAILAVAIVAGWISYTHIYELSLALHQSRMVARLMPIAIDGLMTVGSVTLLQGGRIGWLGIGPGVAISLFANVESGIRYGWLAAVWAGIPAVSFALATFILERWLTGQTQDAPETVADTVADAPLQDADAPLPDADAPEPRISMTLDDAAREFAAEVEAGVLPSVRLIQKRAHAGRPRAKQIRAHLDALMDARPDAPQTHERTCRPVEPVEV